MEERPKTKPGKDKGSKHSGKRPEPEEQISISEVIESQNEALKKILKTMKKRKSTS